MKFSIDEIRITGHLGEKLEDIVSDAFVWWYPQSTKPEFKKIVISDLNGAKVTFEWVEK